MSDLDRALEFWEGLLDTPARWQGLLDRPYLGLNLGYPGLSIRAAFIDLPRGLIELLEYQAVPRSALDPASANPGHVHVCLQTDDLDRAFRRALQCGAIPVAPGGPVEVDGGPNRGARASYLRIPPDSATLELFQPPGSALDGEGGQAE